MIKAELSYNPYLLETLIKFNGREPRINSLVEKFQNNSLQEWVHRIPEIFYDEMNGYDFELEFSGTKSDYEEVVDAFRKKNISEDLVRIFHKNELDGREEKVKLIDALLQWLGDNLNRNFDFQTFMEEHGEFKKRSYTYIIFQGEQLSFEEMNVKDLDIEHLNATKELEKTDLKNTPILFFLSKENFDTFQKDLKWFMEREDVEKSQIFFLMHPALDSMKIERIIKDLGIAAPNVVDHIWDDVVKKYIELYPESEYIYFAIEMFERITNALSVKLQEESEKCARINRAVHQKIDQYENDLQRLKTAYQKFANRDNLDMPYEWVMIQEELTELISSWRKKKTKITNDYEAEITAQEFETDVNRFYAQFLDKIEGAALDTKRGVEECYERWYRETEFDMNFRTNCNEYLAFSYSVDIQITKDLLEIVEEEWVQPKEDLFGMFFKASSDTTKEPVLQKTFYYEKWREYVLKVMQPKVEQVLENYFEKLKNHEKKLSDVYILHLMELMVRQTIMNP